MKRSGPASLALTVGVFAALVISPSAMARPFNLGDVIFGARPSEPKRPPIPMVGRYVDDDGDTSFVLDRSSSLVTLLRYEDNPEIWVLTAQPAPHGDIIYRNDMGEPVLRATWLGGMTLFSHGHPSGAAASLVGEATAIRPATILSPNALLLRLAQASAHSSHAVQRPVEFDAPDVTPLTASLIADAAVVAAEAIEAVAQTPDGHRALGRLTKVLLGLGAKPSASFNGGVLKIVVAPQGALPARDCIAGRPSSHRIAVALAR